MFSKYPFHDYHPGQFEGIVVSICSEILGIGVQEFATGPDGGRDARFVGKAKSFPSESDTWEGKFIIQAKHTMSINEKFSSSDFSSDAASSTLSKEIPRVKSLKQNNEVDHYLLFSNRKLTANANESIMQRIKLETGVKNVHLFGLEALERLLKYYPKAAHIAENTSY